MIVLRALAALGMILLMLVLQLVGFVVIPVALLFHAWDWRVSSVYKDDRHVLAWQWSWLDYFWGNEEDGIDGDPLMAGFVVKNPSWVAATRGWGPWRRVFVWSAWRNSVNNIRFRPIGSSPGYGTSEVQGTTFLADGIKFWLEYHFTANYVLWLGWKPPFDGSYPGFKATITHLDKVGA